MTNDVAAVLQWLLDTGRITEEDLRNAGIFACRTPVPDPRDRWHNSKPVERNGYV